MLRPNMADGRLAKDVQFLRRHVAMVSNGQAKVTDVNDDLRFLQLTVMPSDGLYRGARIRFKLLFIDQYPMDPPRVICLDNIYHPNIDTVFNPDAPSESNVCSSLFEDWTSSMDLDHIIMAILCVLHHPNLEDPLSPYFDGSENAEEFASNVRKTLGGEVLEGVSFPKLLVEENDDGSDQNSSSGNAATTTTTSNNKSGSGYNSNGSSVKRQFEAAVNCQNSALLDLNHADSNPSNCLLEGPGTKRLKTSHHEFASKQNITSFSNQIRECT